VYLLILRFRAESPEDIKTCQADCWLIPHTSSASTASIRYALYRLISDGVHRIIANSLDHPVIQAGSYQRYFRWYDGTGLWRDVDTNTVYTNLAGFRRIFNEEDRRWYWESENSQTQWDTVAFALQ
jgi:hypothetical protein